MTKRQLKPGPFVIPMPVVLVGANVQGKPNFMTAAFVGIVNFNPPVIACGLSPRHHTCEGIASNRTFSINVPSADMVQITDYCGVCSGAKVDKSTLFETFTGELKTAPMIQACPLVAECKLVETVTFKMDTLYMGEIVSVYADNDVIDNDKPIWERIQPLLFTFPDSRYWQLGAPLAEAWSIGKSFER